MPTHCLCGMTYLPDNVIVAYLPCSCAGAAGHCSYRCTTCDLVVYDPPHDAGTEVLTGHWDDG